MGSRLELQSLLETTLGSKNVYFQPPNTVTMQYPAIVYERSRINTIKADNVSYLLHKGYQITVIDRNVDSDIPEKVAMLPMCSFNRHFKADNLNHDVFNLYF